MRRSLESREEWFDLICEQEMAIDLFKEYYEETEYYDLLVEFEMHASDFRAVFYQLLRNAVYDVDSLMKESTPFELDPAEKVEARMFDLQKCCDMLLPGVNDSEVTVGNGRTIHRSASRTSWRSSRCSCSSPPPSSTSLSTTPSPTSWREEDRTPTRTRSCGNECSLSPSLKQQYGITDVRYDILRLFGMAKAGCWEEIRQLYAQRKNIIPIEVGRGGQ